MSRARPLQAPTCEVSAWCPWARRSDSAARRAAPRLLRRPLDVRVRRRRIPAAERRHLQRHRDVLADRRLELRHRTGGWRRGGEDVSGEMLVFAERQADGTDLVSLANWRSPIAMTFHTSPVQANGRIYQFAAGDCRDLEGRVRGHGRPLNRRRAVQTARPRALYEKPVVSNSITRSQRRGGHSLVVLRARRTPN
jgi:hypothetical protein